MARVDLAFATVTFKRKIAYKTTWLFSILFGGWSLLAGLAVWSQIIGDGELGGYDWSAMKAYLVIGFLTATLAWAGSDWEMANRILDGHVAIDLTKPVDFQRARAAEYIGGMTASVPAAILGTALAALAFRPAPPVSALAALLTGISVLFIFPLAFCISYLATMTCFITQRFLGVQWAKDSLVAFFSGMMVPIALMPVWLQGVAWALPFVHFTTTPASIYLGRVDTAGALGLIAAQAAWAAGLWFIARLIWARLVKKVTIHGG
ncbi:ABC transporter permease [Glycomyces paridis]|uniref:Antibiotic ABC transporter permease n=1 Tax=Glycomyces paridis TaxID=2126555 RepID=A0A4S8PLJ2_9ACTN|nr:ABC-2 family transporter protein [Glycomyces paridis]THV30655.1 antibiotic ABC transporter permease [Glycomyces paridis]